MTSERMPVPGLNFSDDITQYLSDNGMAMEVTESRALDEGTWVALEDEKCRVELCLTDEGELEIRALKVFKEGEGVGRNVVTALAGYAEDNSLELQAVDVGGDEEGFWETMSFESDSSGVWHYNG